MVIRYCSQHFLLFVIYFLTYFYYFCYLFSCILSYFLSIICFLVKFVGFMINIRYRNTHQVMRATRAEHVQQHADTWSSLSTCTTWKRRDVVEVS